MTEAIGGYRIVARLGWGCQGDTYEIEYDAGGGRHAVLKQFRTEAHQWRTLLTNEWRALKRLRGASKPPAIPGLLHYDTRERFIVMEHVPGRPLELLPDRRGAIRQWLRLAEAVMFAHDRGVCHCDINPSNILVSGESVALVDWACSKRARSLMNSSQGLPRGAWQPPEQPAGQLGRKTDIYSLSAVLLWLLSGHSPREPVFQGRERRSRDVIRSLIEGPLGHLDCGDLAAYLEKGTAGDSRLRYESVGRLYAQVTDWYRRHCEH